MSLNVFNDVKVVEVLIDCDNQPWFKRVHVGKFLGLDDIRTSVRNLEGDEFCTRKQLGARHNTPGNFKGQDHNVFLSVYGVLHVIVNSRKERGKELKEWVLEDIIPRGVNKKIKQLQEDHRQAIEENESALALINDELQAIQYANVGLQGEIRAKDHQIERCENRI